MFVVGDTVVRRRSVAETLKRKVYRVEHIGGFEYTAPIMCRDPYGKLHTFYEYQLIRTDRLRDNVIEELYNHDQKRVELQNKLNKLEQEMRELKLYFPSI